MDCSSVNDLFIMAARLENAAARLYVNLATKFENDAEVAAFWQAYAEEEMVHVIKLAQLRAKLSSEVLEQKIPAEKLQFAKNDTEVTIATLSEQIENLDDAYEVAAELESGETNAIFEFLITEYEVGQKSRMFLQRQLQQHMKKLTDEFPGRYMDRASRQALKTVDART